MLAREFRSDKMAPDSFYPAPRKNAAACCNNLGHKFIWEIRPLGQPVAAVDFQQSSEICAQKYVARLRLLTAAAIPGSAPLCYSWAEDRFEPPGRTPKPPRLRSPLPARVSFRCL